MIEESDIDYTIKSSLLFIKKLLIKIKKCEGIKMDKITTNMLMEYTPEIEQCLPRIKGKIAELVAFMKKNKYNSLDDLHGQDYAEIRKIFNPLEDNYKYYHFILAKYDKLKYCNPNINDKVDIPFDIDDNVKKIKQKLDKLSESDDEKYDNDCDNLFHAEDINKIELCEISDADEKSASQWDLCELRRICKPCKYQCGEFAINEDLYNFRKKVIKKAEIIISCYKQKLSEYENYKNHLQGYFLECQKKTEHIECKLKDVRMSLQYLNNNVKGIMNHIEQCKQEFPPDDCEKYQNSKKKLMDEIDSSYNILKINEKNKLELLEKIDKLQQKLNLWENESIKIQCCVREINEVVCELNRKVIRLVIQNKELVKNKHTNLLQLGRILSTLKCLCDRYNAFKNKCKISH